MKEVAVVGAGGMGTCIAYALSELGYFVHLVDIASIHDHEKMDKLSVNYLFHNSLDSLNELSVVISAAPYTENQKIATYCLERGIPYCDLGGDPDTTVAIHEKCRLHKGKVFTDLGLAPGLINIITEYEYQLNKQVKDITMAVGGLPVNPQGRLKYGVTWSTKGLRNEYQGSFDIIKDGKITPVSALGGYETFDFPEVSKVEAFYTKGALSTSLNLMYERGVKNFRYKTMRYIGHCNLIQFLLEDCAMDDEVFEKCIKEACPITKQDIVLLMVRMDNDNKFYCVKHDENWTAMQRATAFPAATIASMMAENTFEDKEVLTYADVPFSDLQTKLNMIGEFPNLF